MWARAVLCAALLSALCPAGGTETERDEREVQDYRYNSNRLVGSSVTLNYKFIFSLTFYLCILFLMVHFYTDVII